jgi:hypothetical protein
VRAVWTFWSKPFHAHHHHVWATPRHHLLAWVLSVQLAREHYEETALYTDEEGAKLLVDGLRLPFTFVSTELEALKGADPRWWVLGKLWTYRAQCAPFVHIDSDVFLWKRLPRALEQAQVFGQNPEEFPFDDASWYRPLRYDQAIRDVGGWAPEEWSAYTSRACNTAVCCGIFGGTAVDFVAYYADLAIRMIEHPRNQPAWEAVGSPVSDNILLEQYLLAACVDFHRQSPHSSHRRVRLAYLFDSSEAAFEPGNARRRGYTHLIGGAKSNPTLTDRLRARVEQEYADFYETCLALT